MLQRLLERGKTSGRDDDNMESIKKRFRGFSLSRLIYLSKVWCRSFGMRLTGTFVETSMPVVDYYRKQEGEKVLEVDSTQPVEKVYEDIRKPIEKLLASTSPCLHTVTKRTLYSLAIDLQSVQTLTSTCPRPRLQPQPSKAKTRPSPPRPSALSQPPQLHLTLLTRLQQKSHPQPRRLTSPLALSHRRRLTKAPLGAKRRKGKDAA